jgi:hypothetical protein
MNTSPAIGAISAALAKAQKVIKPAVFDRTNPHFKNKYATLPSIMEAIRAPLADNGIAILQGAEADGPVVKVTTRLAHASGEWVESTLSMTAQQNTPQGVMAALTYCRRGSLSLVCAVSDDDDDGEIATRTEHRLVDHVEATQAPRAAPARTNGAVPSGDVDLKFGNNKGRKLSEVNDDDVRWYVSCWERDLADESKAKFHGVSRKNIEIAESILASRGVTDHSDMGAEEASPFNH